MADEKTIATAAGAGKSEKKISPKTLRRVFWRHYQLLGCFNYERQMSTGYCYTMMPALKELYKDDPAAMKAAVKRHLEFFNCATSTSPFVIGLHLRDGGAGGLRPPGVRRHVHHLGQGGAHGSARRHR